MNKQTTKNKLPDYIYNGKKFIPGETPVYYSGPYWNKKEIKSAINSLLNGKWISSGEEVQKFETEFCKKFLEKYAVMVNSGSSANLLLIAAIKKVLNWNDNDEIILSAVGFPTTLSAILINNLKPVFIDIEIKTLNFDLNQIEEKITSKTKAIFLSPVLGNSCDMDLLLDICKKYNLEIILDNCDSLGSKWKDKYLTEYALASSHSFYPAHHITTGEGGMITSNNNKIITTARSMSFWGRECYCIGTQNLCSEGMCKKRFHKWIPELDVIIDHKYFFSNIGFNLKPLDLQGAIGSVQLTKFDEIHKKRIKSKKNIQKILESNIKGITIINELKNASTCWFGTPIICENNKLKSNLVKYLEQNKIQTRNYFAGNILLHPAYKHLDDYKKYPNSNMVLERVFFLGASPHYTTKTFNYIKKIIQNFKNE